MPEPAVTKAKIHLSTNIPVNKMVTPVLGAWHHKATIRVAAVSLVGHLIRIPARAHYLPLNALRQWREVT
jgi:hypothetical protein